MFCKRGLKLATKFVKVMLRERETSLIQLQVDAAYLNHNASLLLFSVALPALCEQAANHIGTITLV